MKVEVSGDAVVASTPAAVLDFAHDVAAYAAVDPKIGRVYSTRRDGDVVEATFRPRIPGIGLQEMKVVARLTRTDDCVDMVLAPRPANRLNHWLATYRSTLTCTPASEGTSVTRRVTYDFNPVVGWLFAPVLRRGLRRAIPLELRQLQAHFAS